VSTTRLLQVIPSFDQAGAEKQLCLLAAGLPRDRFETHVVALTRGGPMAVALDDAGVPWDVIGKRFRFDPRALVKLKRYIARLKPDVVHTWMLAANAYGVVASAAAGVKHIVCAHRCVDPWKGRLDLMVDRYVARHCRRVVVNSPGVRDFYVAKGLPADRIVIIPNGVRPLPPPTRTREELLAELGLPEGTRLVGNIGRLWPQKRTKDAIWAADLLKVVRDDVHMVVIGDGPLRDRIIRYRDQVEIRDRVHLLGHRDDVANILPHLDVLLSASGYEGQSNVILEAMTAGVPVVATDIPGNRDLIASDRPLLAESGRTGILVPLGDRAAMAREVNRLLDNPDLAKSLAAASRERVEQEFSVERMIERHVALYGELLG
jgi:glycosyltransferase involved in cell wall biosynthesis